MAQDDFFDLSLEENFDSFDPLFDVDDDTTDEDAPIESGAVRPDPKEFLNAQQLAEDTRRLEQQPAEVRIATLFDHMRPFRKTLLSTLAFCADEPQPNSRVEAHIAVLQETNKSVYSADNLCMMMVRAGALTRLTEDGRPYEVVEATLEPKTVIIDGVEYLEPVTPPEIYWLTTPEGKAALEADRPADRLRALLESEPQYRHLYRLWLTFADTPAGANQKDLSRVIDNDPAVQRPRMYAMRFGEKLAENEALEWRDRAWHITDLGRQALELLDELDGGAHIIDEDRQ